MRLFENVDVYFDTATRAFYIGIILANATRIAILPNESSETNLLLLAHFALLEHQIINTEVEELKYKLKDTLFRDDFIVHLELHINKVLKYMHQIEKKFLQTPSGLVMDTERLSTLLRLEKIAGILANNEVQISAELKQDTSFLNDSKFINPYIRELISSNKYLNSVEFAIIYGFIIIEYMHIGQEEIKISMYAKLFSICEDNCIGRIINIDPTLFADYPIISEIISKINKHLISIKLKHLLVS
jgi:hypothetical protein